MADEPVSDWPTMEDRPTAYDVTADRRVWSNTVHGDRRLSWKEVYEAECDRNRRLQALALVLADLDRCEHGRHEGDTCGGAAGCNGASHGNPYMSAGYVIGYTISAEQIVVPERADRHDPAAWVPQRKGRTGG